MKRFAIYFAPPEHSPLSRMATTWLGRDAFAVTKTALPEPPLHGFSHEVWRASTADPRVYGFHATLKPPFRLNPSARIEELVEGLKRFAKKQTTFTAPALKVASLSSFIALTLSGPCAAFDALAAVCVREFDPFRAPPAEEELARRRRAKLSAKQLEYLTQWGYPYVMEEWRFHMTLTSSLEPAIFETLATHLTSLFSPYCLHPFLVDSICLFEQDGPGEPFHVVERFPFA
jgi:putative phosphonate metabolism protein